MKFRFVQLFLLVSAGSLFADRITVHNKTPRDLYTAIYYIGSKYPLMEQPKATLASKIYFVEADASANVERPPQRVKPDPSLKMIGLGPFDRQLVFVEDKNLLTDQLTKEQLDKYHSKNVGNLQGDVFYIAARDGELAGYTTADWNVAKHVIETAACQIKSQLPAITLNPFQTTVAMVRIGDDVSEGERSYLIKRKPVIERALEKLVAQPLRQGQSVKIALVLSGGGQRAMLYSLGAVRALEQAGLFDALTYIVSLSGATWGISSWYSSGQPLQTFSDNLIGQLGSGLTDVTTSDARMIGEALLTKYFFDQPLGPVDLYGGLLANVYLRFATSGKQRTYLSEQINRINNGQMPLPIYSAVRAESVAAENTWYEFTPYEVSLGDFHVPAWAFGRKFINGSSVSMAPELSLGNLMGIWGFAIGVSIKRILQEIDLEKKMPFQCAKNVVEIIDEQIGATRVSKAEVFNFTYGMQQSSIKNLRFLSLTDAGVSYSLMPYPPISGERKDRAVDLIIFVDASDTLDSVDTRNPKGSRVPTLKIIEYYAQDKKLPFPPISYDQISKKTVSVFNDELNPQKPVIIYQPRISNVSDLQQLQENRPDLAAKIQELNGFDMAVCLKGPCKSENWTYPKDIAHKVMLAGELNMKIALDSIIDSIKWLMERRGFIKNKSIQEAASPVA